MNRVIRHAIALVRGGLWGISGRHVASVRGLAMSRKASAKVNLPGEVTARRVYGQLILSRVREEEADPFCCRVEGPGTYRVERLGCVFRLQELEGPGNFVALPSANTAFFDAGKIDYPLMIRNVRPGDRFVPHGMAGRKKLQDFFIDRKIPRERRSRLPLLVQGEAVIWVCGYRTDDRFRVHPETGRILRVDLVEQVERSKEAGRNSMRGEVEVGDE
jgi:tRNA(Ile)-lysidine synthase